MLTDILNYLKQGHQDIPETELEEKLNQISADHFATEVHDFYDYAIANYQEKQEEELND